MSSISVLPRLPVDIFERALTELAADEPSLSACVRVSRRWREISCPFRFHTVSLYTRYQFDSFCKWAKTPAAQEVVWEIKTLKLIGRIQDLLGFALDCELFASLLPNLPGLDQVYIQDIHLARLPSPTKGRLLRPIRSFTQRTTRRLPVMTQTPTRTTLPALLSIVAPETLILDDGIYYEYSAPQSRFPASKIKRLTLSDNTPLRTIASSGVLAPDAMEHVAFSWSYWDQLDELYRFFQSVGRHIRSMDLHLSLRDRYLRAGCYDQLGGALALCQSLNTLRLRLRIPPEGIAPSHSVLKGICSLVPRTLCACIVHFGHLEIEGGDTLGHARWLDLEELDRPWFRERFPNLQSVTVELEPSANLHTPAVLNLLPKLHEAQLLSVIEAQ
ncbi:hypothetical protein C8T65DRAFT_737070 [Cerioporus squamosus]|nr:hypothetical protein C8T65DRAFT_737070 [Cerioporus squamosus]